jgi:hypothetical protein
MPACISFYASCPRRRASRSRPNVGSAVGHLLPPVAGRVVSPRELAPPAPRARGARQAVGRRVAEGHGVGGRQVVGDAGEVQAVGAGVAPVDEQGRSVLQVGAGELVALRPGLRQRQAVLFVRAWKQLQRKPR